MLVAVANFAESSQLLHRLTTDPGQSCTLRIKGGQKNLRESRSFIVQSFVLPTELPSRSPGHIWIRFWCRRHLLCTWTRTSSFADTQDGGEAAGWASHYSLAASCQQQNQDHDTFLPHWFKTERKVCHQLWLLCYGRFEMSPNNLMKQNDSDPLPLQCTQFPPKDEARKQR